VIPSFVEARDLNSIRLAALCGRRLMIFVFSEITGRARQVQLEELIDWSKGKNIPNFLNDFEGWWFAQSIRYRMATTSIAYLDCDEIAKRMSRAFEESLMRVPPNIIWDVEPGYFDRMYTNSSSTSWLPPGNGRLVPCSSLLL
jgi:hypothetical protein